MPKKRPNTEDIIHTLCEADVQISQGKTVSEVCKHPGVSDQTYYRWRKTYGGMCLIITVCDSHDILKSKASM